MIQLTDDLWIGNSEDERGADLVAAKIDAILDVAQDLRPTRWWSNELEYMQVGLIDGPGNPIAAYYAAILSLSTLYDRGSVLVCCHDGGRSLAVALMYLNVRSPRTWDDWLAILQERIDAPLPDVHVAHRKAFGNIKWPLLGKLIGD